MATPLALRLNGRAARTEADTKDRATGCRTADK